jgi:hypothetical protein
VSDTNLVARDPMPAGAYDCHMSESVFIRDGDRFIPTDLAGSPWGEGLLHGGPPAGLLARAIEHALPDADMHVARLTVDLFRPVPKAPLTIATHVVREGKRIAVMDATLVASGLEVARAAGLLLRKSEVALPPHALPLAPYLEGPDDLPVTGLGPMRRPGDQAAPPPAFTRLRGFHTTVEVRRVAGEPGSGKGTAWIRIPVPFVAGEETSPLVRVAATSDFSNPLGHIRPSEAVGFINADITLYLHRLPRGEWICLETSGVAEPHGLGMVESVVHDVHGPLGRVTQALIVNRRQG